MRGVGSGGSFRREGASGGRERGRPEKIVNLRQYECVEDADVCSGLYRLWVWLRPLQSLHCLEAGLGWFRREGRTEGGGREPGVNE